MKFEAILFKKDHSFEQCPSCNAVGQLRKSRPKNKFERSSKLGLWSYYRCKDCGWRGRKFCFSFRRTSFKTILIYILLMLATAVIVRFIIQKFAMK